MVGIHGGYTWWVYMVGRLGGETWWGERTRDPGKRQLAPAAGGFAKEVWMVDSVTKSHA
jgi:hypothetical protein